MHVLENLLSIVGWGAFLCFTIGIIKPSIFSFLFKGVTPTRMKITVVFLGVFWISGIIHGQVYDSVKVTEPQTQRVATIKEEVKNNLPKIKFAGQVNPVVVTRGSKVVIKIDVENLDKEKTIDNIRLLFSDSDFLEQGLVIVNVMSGGQQDGRAFVWQNELAKIKPGEKRSFQIVAQANKPGKYNSVISIKDVKSGKIYEELNGNAELVANLTVLN